MPTTVNYTSLFNDIVAYMERGGSAVTDPTVNAQIPRLINAAERKLAQDLKLLGQIETLVDSPSGLQLSNPIVTKPDRWRGTISMVYGAGPTFNTRTPLFPRAKEYIETYWPDQSMTDSNNPPKYYAELDYQHWLIGPTPDQNYPLQITVYCQPPLLDSVNQTNFWTDYTPNALEYGAMLETALFLKDDARIQTFGTLWQGELTALGAQDLQRMLDRAAERKAP